MKHILSVNIPGESDPREYTLENPITTVGRSVQNDIHLKVEEVSTRHLELHLSEDGKTLKLLDLGSTNGTTIGGEEATPNTQHTVSEGDAIVIGATLDATIKLAADDTAVAPNVVETPELDTSAAAPTVMLKKAPLAAPKLNTGKPATPAATAAPKLATPVMSKPGLATPSVAKPANPLGRPATVAATAAPAIAKPVIAKVVPDDESDAKPAVALKPPGIAKPAVAKPVAAAPSKSGPIAPRKLTPPGMEVEEDAPEAVVAAVEAKPVLAKPTLSMPKVAKKAAAPSVGKPTLHVPKSGDAPTPPKLNIG